MEDRNGGHDERADTDVEDPLVTSLGELAEALAALPFGLPDGAEAAGRRDRVVGDIGGQQARIRDAEAPLLAVLGGGTGAGKSTVLNTLLGKRIAATGVIRPTTSSPTLVATPSEMEWFAGERVLPGLARVERRDRTPVGGEEARVLHLVASRALPQGLALIDTPDIDSVRTSHRDLADELLDAADVWVWLVTPRTYADADGMAYLRRAARRRTALGVVLTQVHDRHVDELTEDLQSKLADEGLAEAAILTVPYAAPEGDRLPSWAVEDVRAWLARLARPETREHLRRQTLDGAIDDLRHEIAPLRARAEADRAALEQLSAAVAQAYGEVPDRVNASLDEGLPLRQEILERWTAFVGGQRFQEFVESATGMVQGWLRNVLDRRTGAEEERVEREVRAEIGGVIAERIAETLDLVAAETADAWQEDEAGSALVAAHPELRRAAPTIRDHAGDLVVAWQDTIVELIRTKGADRKIRARWLSTLVNAGATAAIVLAFASTGGLTGVEVGLAAGASAVNQWILTKLLGEQNVRWLLERIREELRERVDELAAAERARFDAVLEGKGASDEALERLANALAAVDEARSG